MDLAASDAVQDCVIVIGEGSGVDAFGRLWLRHDDNVRAWARALNAADVDTIHSRRALVRRVQAAEAAVASTLGIAAIFAGDRLGLSSVYEDYLRVSVFFCQSVSGWRPLCAWCSACSAAVRFPCAALKRALWRGAVAGLVIQAVRELHSRSIGRCGLCMTLRWT